MAREYRVVSSDSHLEISPERWRSYVPEKYRDRAPHMIRLSNGAEAVMAENQPLRPTWAHNAGIPWEEWGPDHYKELGLKGVSLDAYPNGKLSPKSEDDQFWAAALEMEMPLTVHTTFSEMR